MARTVQTQNQPAPTLERQTLIINALEVDARIGVHAWEKEGPQPIILWLDVELGEPHAPSEDALEEVVCYEAIVQDIMTVLDTGHINLVETLAQDIAAQIMYRKNVARLRIRIEKPKAIAEAIGVGIDCLFSQ